MVRTTTCELRWFFPGAVPAAVSRWFDSSAAWGFASAAPARERIDRYAALPGVEELGIKWRSEGGADRLELKGRLRGPEDCTLAGVAAAGRLEQWVKWSLETEPGIVIERAIEVRKRRVLRCATLPRGGEAVAVPADAPLQDLERGIQAELTRVELADSTSWSIAFEASPLDPSLPDDLSAASARFLEGWPGPELVTEQSFGYAALLWRHGGTS